MTDVPRQSLPQVKGPYSEEQGRVPGGAPGGGYVHHGEGGVKL